MTPVSTYQVSKKIKVWRTANFNCVIIRSALKTKLLWYNTIKNCNKRFIMSFLLSLMAKTIETIFCSKFFNFKYTFSALSSTYFYLFYLKFCFSLQPFSKEVSGMEGRREERGGREEVKTEREKGRKGRQEKKRKLSLLNI